MFSFHQAIKTPYKRRGRLLRHRTSYFTVLTNACVDTCIPHTHQSHHAHFFSLHAKGLVSGIYTYQQQRPTPRPPPHTPSLFFPPASSGLPHHTHLLTPTYCTYLPTHSPSTYTHRLSAFAMKNIRRRIRQIVKSSSPATKDQQGDGMSVSDTSQHSSSQPPLPLPPQLPQPRQPAGEDIYHSNSSSGVGGASAAPLQQQQIASKDATACRESMDVDLLAPLQPGTNRKRMPIVNNPEGGPGRSGFPGCAILTDAPLCLFYENSTDTCVTKRVCALLPSV